MVSFYQNIMGNRWRLKWHFYWFECWTQALISDTWEVPINSFCYPQDVRPCWHILSTLYQQGSDLFFFSCSCLLSQPHWSAPRSGGGKRPPGSLTGPGSRLPGPDEPRPELALSRSVTQRHVSRVITLEMISLVCHDTVSLSSTVGSFYPSTISCNL